MVVQIPAAQPQVVAEAVLREEGQSPAVRVPRPEAVLREGEQSPAEARRAAEQIRAAAPHQQGLVLRRVPHTQSSS